MTKTELYETINGSLWEAHPPLSSELEVFVYGQAFHG